MQRLSDPLSRSLLAARLRALLVATGVVVGGLVVGGLVVGGLVVGGCSQKAPQGKPAQSATAGGNASANSTAGPTPKVALTTSLGTIVLELDPQRAPKTVENFLVYVKAGHYAGTIFHRVISSFMIQGGGFDAELQKKPTRAPIPNEADNGLRNAVGTIAMARTMDPHSASAQFFINVQDNPALDHREKSPRGWGYAVFGRVTTGMDVVEKIKAVPTTARGMHRNLPVTPVMITEAKVLN